MSSVVSLDGRRVLVIAYGHVADTMAAIPALGSLRAAYPGARLEVLSLKSVAPLLETCPYVDEVVTWSDFKGKGHRGARAEKAVVLGALAARLRRRRYSGVIVLHRSFPFMRRLAGLVGAPVRVGVSTGDDGFTHCAAPADGIESSREENQRVLRAIGLSDEGREISLWTAPEDDAWAERFMGPRTNTLVGIHPGSDWSCQQWLPERWSEVASRIQTDLDCGIVITGSGAEIELQEEIATGLADVPLRGAGQTTLRQLVAVISRVEMLVCVNSAAAAIARAVGTPAVVLLGPEDARFTDLRPGRRLQVLQPSASLPPGSWCELGRWGVLSGCESPMCRGMSGLDQLTPEAVVQATRQMLRDGRRAGTGIADTVALTQAVAS